jgi:uncharacterized protein YgiM (DUF1202 family)
MKKRKITIEIIAILSFVLCTALIIFFNFNLKRIADNSIAEVSTVSTDIKEETNKENSLNIDESKLNVDIDNFADTNKLPNNQVITVEKVEKQMVVTANKLNVRKEANSNLDNVIKILSKGDIVKVIGLCDNGWIEIEIDGEPAYTYEKYLKDIN